jgi:hypothetical protein
MLQPPGSRPPPLRVATHDKGIASFDGAVLHILFLFSGLCRPYFNVNFLSADAAVCILFSFLTDDVVRILL